MRINRIKVQVTKSNPPKYEPGKQFHDMEVLIEEDTKGHWFVDIYETWGKFGLPYKVLGRHQANITLPTLDRAIECAKNFAEISRMDPELLAQALSQATTEAKEAIQARARQYTNWRQR